MADARALLRARRQDVRVTHSLAAYNSAGQLRCIACGVPVKTVAAWEGHVGSKPHRLAVAEMRRREEAEREGNRKRKAGADGEEMDVDDNVETGLGAGAKKRRLSEEPAAGHLPSKANSGFPADFFSDPSLVPVPSVPDDDTDEEEPSSVPAPVSAPTNAKTVQKSQIDLEWEQFQASLLSSNAASAGEEETEEGRREAYDRATVFAEPELASSGAEGFPSVINVPGGETTGEEGGKQETEEERRRKKEQEERELIMDRLVEEERAQEEADERVGMLKARIETLKRAREAKRTERGAKVNS
ncbi:hypothetical protein M0805_007247 [Coniferiporia weirii]|nr:hypothetical protein M0805_007247 [Coniferiporia weirii]